MKSILKKSNRTIECLRFVSKQASVCVHACVCVCVCVCVCILGDDEVGGVYIKQGWP